MHGMRVLAPTLIAVCAWGLVTGIAMVKVGLSVPQAIGASLLIFAGSAQLAAIPLIAAAAPVGVILLTAAIVNLRFVIFSAALEPYFRRFPLNKRLLLGYMTSDVAFAISVQRWTQAPEHERGSTAQVWFFLGMAACNWLGWQTASIVGIVLADYIPRGWGLEFAAIIALIALTVPMVTSAPIVVGVIVAGVVAIAAAGLPLKLGLVIAVIAGITASMTADIALERKKKS